MSRFRFVADHRDVYDVKRLCRLVQVSRSGFYAWLSRPPTARAVSDERVGDLIEEIHAESLGTYGRPRITGVLRRRGHLVNHKRVARLMRARGLTGVTGRRRWRRGTARPAAPAPDLLERDFTADEPDRRWVADITEFTTGEGTLYLAGILDLSLRGLVGWSMGPTRPAELVVDALAMAIARRDPPAGVIHHADRGAQYTSTAFCDAAADAQVALSFGRTGDALDNAAMEAYWSVLKRELAHIHGRQTWRTRAQLRTALFDYIEVFHFRQRHQAGLGHRTPAEHDTLFTAA